MPFKPERDLLLKSIVQKVTPLRAS
jgi:hypothetical protein